MKLFEEEVYVRRRAQLMAEVGEGIIIIMGNGEAPMNYKDNVYPFRQNSNFLYYFGINLPDLNAIIDIEAQNAVIYGHELTMDDIIWMGEVEKISSLADKVGVKSIKEPSSFVSDLSNFTKSKRKIHYLPPYRMEHVTLLEEALALPYHQQLASASVKLILAVVHQRSIKSTIELAEIEKSVNITRDMHLAAMKATKVGRYEYEIVGEILKTCKAHHAYPSYGIIFSVNGQVLHNHHHDNLMEEGRMVINDSGAENDMCYAGDITRCFPVNGKFTMQQSEIYKLVLEMEKTSILKVAPGIPYRDVHLHANRVLLNGFKDLGLLTGDVDEMLDMGVAGLFMPHGLGHMLGLDVHDMEDLGEKYVGYEEGQQRSTLLGLKSLRLARKLQPGFTLTVEPGIYFIPQLIEKYKNENKFKGYVNYDKLLPYYNFGGIRIEDNVVVTSDGVSILGNYIPKEIEEVEAFMKD